jgi:DNA excision repair protein ERCC-2
MLPLERVKPFLYCFPAVKAVGEGMGERIFYLTAKTVTRQVAEQTIKIMMEKGLVLSLHYTYFQRKKLLYGYTCPVILNNAPMPGGIMIGLTTALMDILQLEGILTREIVLEYAQKASGVPI